MRPLTDLELTALANVWKKGGATAYQVMQEFARSTSSYYRSGAGSIYPIMTRLARRGLIRAADATRGRRSARAYRATPRGVAALREWLTSPPAESDVLLAPDPIRTRVYFFGAIAPAQQQRVLGAALAALKAQLAANQDVVRLMQAAGNRYGVMAMHGALQAVQARIRWIEWLRTELKKSPKPNAPRPAKALDRNGPLKRDGLVQREGLVKPEGVAKRAGEAPAEPRTRNRRSARK